jgi:hypothetical protein
VKEGKKSIELTAYSSWLGLTPPDGGVRPDFGNPYRTPEMLSTALSQSHTADNTPCLAPLLPQFSNRYATFIDQLLHLFSPKMHCDDGFAVFFDFQKEIQTLLQI